jgi:zinc ribbon protein
LVILTAVFCRSCGKQIEADARFCRYCGVRQAEPAAGKAAPGSGTAAPPAASKPAGGGGLELRLRRLFPRHHLQDEFMHLATIVAFVVAVVGFIFGMTSLWAFGVTWLLFSIALLLFLMIRESTLSHVRVHPDSGRFSRARPSSREEAPAAAEGATAESAPPAPARTQAPPSGGSPAGLPASGGPPAKP